MADHEPHDPKWVVLDQSNFCRHIELSGHKEPGVGVGGFVCEDCSEQQILIATFGGTLQLEVSIPIGTALDMVDAIHDAIARICPEALGEAKRRLH